MNETTKRTRNVRATSKESFQKVLKSDKTANYKQQILQALTAHQPVTARYLSELLGIERISICRPLNDLVNETNPKIKEAFTAKCLVTNHRVTYYALIDYKQA